MGGCLQQRSVDLMRIVLSTASLLCGCLSWGATLEKLSIEQMAQKSTLIVRGRVGGCTGDPRGSLIYTRCRVDVTERWKGVSGTQVNLLIPGGTAQGLTQEFNGTPKFKAGEEYVLFLWSGRSGILQVIGLSQGVFDVKDAVTAKRDASPSTMLDAGGQLVQDDGLQLTVTALRNRVTQALGGASK